MRRDGRNEGRAESSTRRAGAVRSYRSRSATTMRSVIRCSMTPILCPSPSTSLTKVPLPKPRVLERR